MVSKHPSRNKIYLKGRNGLLIACVLYFYLLIFFLFSCQLFIVGQAIK